MRLSRAYSFYAHRWTREESGCWVIGAGICCVILIKFERGPLGEGQGRVVRKNGSSGSSDKIFFQGRIRRDGVLWMVVVVVVVRCPDRDRINAGVESARTCLPTAPTCTQKERTRRRSQLSMSSQIEIPSPLSSLVKDESFNISCRRANRIANGPFTLLAAERNTKYVRGVPELPELEPIIRR